MSDELTANLQPASRASLRVREMGVLGVLLLEIALFALLVKSSSGNDSWTFLQSANLLDILRDTAIIGIAAIGVTCVIITGGIDLSVGGLIALSCVITAHLLRAGVAPPLAIGAALLVGIVSGAIAAGLITGLALPPFIATLGVMLVARGLAFVVSGGDNLAVTTQAPWLTDVFGNDTVLGVPYLVILLAILALAFAVLLARTVWGRQLFAVGGNEVAARYAGVDVRRIKWSVYLLSGFLAALAGVIYVARFGTGRSDAAEGYELDAVAAAVVGGASLAGGRGSIIGAVLGAVIFTTLRAGLNQVTGASAYQNVIVGAVVIGAVVVDRLIQKRVGK
jgi:ribose/xylose/arabinose/galactoside ABC-type transport system permease subunit